MWDRNTTWKLYFFSSLINLVILNQFSLCFPCTFKTLTHIPTSPHWLHVFVQVCTCVVVCAFPPICDHLFVWVCVRARVHAEWAPCQAAGATFSFSLRSRRSLEQRSLILSAGACGLEACCCLPACPPLCSCRPARIKVLMLSCFIPCFENKSQEQDRIKFCMRKLF